MARIAGVDLPKDKRIEIGLTYIFGIGMTSAKQILSTTGVNPDTRVNKLIHEKTNWKTFIHTCGSVWDLLPDLIEAGLDI